MAQLPLALTLKPHASLDSFVVGTNGAAIEHIKSIALGGRRDSVWLYGSPNTGKSHLLAAACRAAGEAAARPIYLSLDPDSEPEMLRHLDDMDLIALDDVHQVAGDPSWEAALFSLFDERLQRGGLVAAADAAPRECGFELSDLVSRAGAAAVYRLDFLDDAGLRAAVVRHASMRGLSLDGAAATWLLRRVSRDLGTLTDSLDRIDRHALATQRRITIPLLREVIGV